MNEINAMPIMHPVVSWILLFHELFDTHFHRLSQSIIIQFIHDKFDFNNMFHFEVFYYIGIPEVLFINLSGVRNKSLLYVKKRNFGFVFVFLR